MVVPLFSMLEPVDLPLTGRDEMIGGSRFDTTFCGRAPESAPEPPRTPGAARGWKLSANGLTAVPPATVLPPFDEPTGTLNGSWLVRMDFMPGGRAQGWSPVGANDMRAICFLSNVLSRREQARATPTSKINDTKTAGKT